MARRRRRNRFRGEFGFTLEGKEIGHLHGDHVLHIGFPKAVWHELYRRRRIDYHPVFPGKPGFGARRIESDDDVRDAIELLRINYDRVVARHGVPMRPEMNGIVTGASRGSRARVVACVVRARLAGRGRRA